MRYKRLEKAQFCWPRIGHHRVQLNHAAGFTKFGTRISVSRGHRFQKVRDSDFTKSRTKIAADLDRFS
ncbi:hypothetical protein ELI45_38675 [Rhizobium ruizarguesonis]|nr:hypothetical protein ELI45_38675 [Rhizobium ruizarguesonis]